MRALRDAAPLQRELAAIVCSRDPQAAARGFRERVLDCNATRARLTGALSLVSRYEWRTLLASAGVTPAEGIGRQIRAKLGAMLLPALVPENDIRAWLDPIFEESAALDVVDSLTPEAISEVLLLLGLDESVLREELEVAAHMLSLRVAAAGTDSAMARRSAALGLDPAPFLTLAPQVAALLEPSGSRLAKTKSSAKPAVLRTISACRDIATRLRADHRVGGSSLQLTTATRRVLEQLSRLERIVSVLTEADASSARVLLAALLRDVVVAHYSHVTLGQVVSDTGDLVAFQITEQAAESGKKYVAHASYWRLFRAGLLGGVIVAVFACLKLLIAKVGLPIGVEALVYGLNYSLCFLLIYAAGATLATKQPAFTAAAIASLIDQDKDRAGGLQRVAQQITVVWRNQLGSLLGNMLCALPVAAAIALAFSSVFGSALASPEKATALIDTNAPWRSLALYYAAIAGVFLFISGLIQGAVSNRVAYAEVGERLRRHPRLAFLGPRREKWADKLTPHLGAISGNIALGFLLGSAGTIGTIFGLPLDIRHVAFSSAHVGVAFSSGLGFAATAMLVVVAGVLLIGVVNFAFSFGLTLWVSLKSRRVTFTQWRALLVMLAVRLVRRPLSWLMPSARDFDEECVAPGP